MERAIKYFEQYELFQPKEGYAKRAYDITRSVSGQIDEWYDSFWDVAMKYSDGDIHAAEHMMDTSVFMFYYRIKQKAAYIQWYNEQAKTKP